MDEESRAQESGSYTLSIPSSAAPGLFSALAFLAPHKFDRFDKMRVFNIIIHDSTGKAEIKSIYRFNPIESANLENSYPFYIKQCCKTRILIAIY